MGHTRARLCGVCPSILGRGLDSLIRDRPEKRLSSSEAIKKGCISLRAAKKEQEMENGKAQTILVPLNGSPEPEAALPYAVSIARAFGASVRLLGVIETGADAPFVQIADQNGESVERLRDAARTYLAGKRPNWKPRVWKRQLRSRLATWPRNICATRARPTHRRSSWQRMAVAGSNAGRWGASRTRSCAWRTFRRSLYDHPSLRTEYVT